MWSSVGELAVAAGETFDAFAAARRVHRGGGSRAAPPALGRREAGMAHVALFGGPADPIVLNKLFGDAAAASTECRRDAFVRWVVAIGAAPVAAADRARASSAFEADTFDAIAAAHGGGYAGVAFDAFAAAAAEVRRDCGMVELTPTFVAATFRRLDRGRKGRLVPEDLSEALRPIRSPTQF